ncbi:MAG TPA: efflux RND transporter periplasmic adaptor subunit [Bryobacteraceae bacterium]|nr:efflux RND transporter periplasmic adaptor subunit [Bryobacteraceae bacterium]
MPRHARNGWDEFGIRKALWIPLLAVLTGLLLLSGCSNSGSAAAAGAGPAGGGGGKGGGRKGGGGGGDVPVTVAQATQKNVPVEVQVIGNVEAYSTISVKAQVTGQLTKVDFHEGDYVKKNEELFTIDPRPLQAALNQAQANLAKDEATLGQVQANLARDEASAKYAQAQATRYSELFASGIISKDQSEQLRAQADAASQAVVADKAAIESARASIGASQAAVENARVQLGYTTINSPIDGRTGNLAVKQGNIVMANNVELTTINQVEPIYVTFAVPEAQLPAIKKYMAEGKLPVRARPQDDPGGEETGVLTFVDNAVDTTTGTIKLKGTFQNGDHKLWPGQFVRVVLRLTTQQNAVTVPNEAVQTGQNGSFVYVVKPDRTVESRPVTTSARVDQDMVVDTGLEPGETVVTEGQLRLAPGSRVVIRDGRGGGGGRRSGGDQTTTDNGGRTGGGEQAGGDGGGRKGGMEQVSADGGGQGGGDGQRGDGSRGGGRKKRGGGQGGTDAGSKDQPKN